MQRCLPSGGSGETAGLFPLPFRERMSVNCRQTWQALRDQEDNLGRQRSAHALRKLQNTVTDVGISWS